MTHLNLSIKDVPESLAQRLRERAARNHRSLQGELMAIIEQAAFGSQAGPVHAPTLAAPPEQPSRRIRRRLIEDIAREHRLRFPQAITTGPNAVDIIRADRDAR